MRGTRNVEQTDWNMGNLQRKSVITTSVTVYIMSTFKSLTTDTMSTLKSETIYIMSTLKYVTIDIMST